MIAFRNLYPNLPGHLVEFKDGGLALRVEADPPKTDSMLILGTAIDGPVMEPVAVDATTAELLFGKAVKGNGVPNGSTLIPAFEEAWNAGCRDIRLMRISGDYAVAEIKAEDLTSTTQKLKTEQLGVAPGNDETVITLANKHIVPNSAKVYVKGTQLLTGFTVDEAAGKVTIAAGVDDAGASVSVSYKYFAIEDVANEAATVEGGKVTLTYDIDSIVSIKVNGDPATPVYTVSGKDITFESGVAEGDNVAVTYKGITTNEITAQENGTGTDPFLTATSLMVVPIGQSPVPGTMHLYANGTEILTSGAFTVDGTAKTISIKKEMVSKGALLEISYMYNETATQTPKIEITSIYGGEVYNQAKVEVVDVKDSSGNVMGKKVILTKPESKKAQVAEEPLSYSSLDYPNFMLLVQAINNDPMNNVFKASTKFNNVETSKLLTKTPTFFLGGADGINLTKEELFEALSGKRNEAGLLTKQGAYQLLEDYQVDWVVPVGVYADDELPGKFQNFAYELAMFCAVLSYRNKMTFGAINMKPVEDTGLSSIQEHAKKLAAFENLYYMRDSYGNIIKDSNGNFIDLGGFINVVAGPEIAVRGTSLGTYNADPAVSYVAFSTTLNPQSAAGNKTIPNGRGLRYRFSNAQLDSIVARRLTVLKLKQDGSVSVVDDATCAAPGSDYARRTTGKVVREVVDQIREVCDPFIGEPNTIEQRNAMSATISKRLGQLKDAGVIQDYDFQVVATLQDQLLGQAKIELTLVPPQELRKITTVVSLKPSL
jgi:hypothetical protein